MKSARHDLAIAMLLVAVALRGFAAEPLAQRIRHTDLSTVLEGHSHGGVGTVQYRRALDSNVFLTNLAYMDHEVIPPGASDGLHRHNGVKEVYCVMEGIATFQLNDEKEPVKAGDAIPVKFYEAHAIINNGSAPIELMVMGTAAKKDVIDTELGSLPRGPAQ